MLIVNDIFGNKINEEDRAALQNFLLVKFVGLGIFEARGGIEIMIQVVEHVMEDGDTTRNTIR